MDYRALPKLSVNSSAVGRQRRYAALRFLPWLALCVAFSVAAAACSGSGSGGPDGGGNPYGDLALTMYTGADIVGGDQLALSDLQGQPVVLNFWAGLCPPCRAEMPDLQEFHEEIEGRALLVGVDVGQFTMLGGEPEARALLDSLNITYPTGFTGDREIMKKYAVVTMPTTVFITPEGEVFRKWSGVLDHAKLSEITNEMLAQ